MVKFLHSSTNEQEEVAQEVSMAPPRHRELNPSCNGFSKCCCGALGKEINCSKTKEKLVVIRIGIIIKLHSTTYY